MPIRRPELRNGEPPRHDFRREQYPVTFEALHPKTRAVVWSAVMELPQDGQPQRLYIPPLREKLGHAVAMRIRTADGTVFEKEPELAN